MEQSFTVHKIAHAIFTGSLECGRRSSGAVMAMEIARTVIFARLAVGDGAVEEFFIVLVNALVFRPNAVRH